MNQLKLQGYLGYLAGILLVVGGTFIALDSWTMMQQIQAQGLVGQAFNQEAYQTASGRFTIAGVAAVVGFALLIPSHGDVVTATLEELAD